MISISSGRSCARLRRVAVLSILVLAATHTSAFADPVAKFTNNGAYAFAYGVDVSGCVSTYVSVDRSGTKAAPQTWLYYNLYDRCASETIAFGYGTIPSTAFKVANQKISLNVNVATVGTLYREGITGTISLTFVADGAFKVTFSGHQTWSYPDFTLKEHGSWSASTSTVTGTLMNVNVASIQGQTGESLDREKQFERLAK